MYLQKIVAQVTAFLYWTRGMKHILLLSRNQGFGTPDGHQIMPFAMYSSEIESSLGLQVINIPTQSPTDRTAAITRFLTRTESESLTHIIVMPHWSEPAEALCKWFDQTKAQLCRANHSATKIMMLDYYAPICSPHFPVMAHVDRYIKRQTFNDHMDYSNEYQSGHSYAEFVADTWGFDLADWQMGSKMPPEHSHKLVSGWSLGVTPQYRMMLNWSSRVQVPWKYRPIDIQQRVSGLDKPGCCQDWYQFSRTKGIESLKKLRTGYRQTATNRVSRKKYFLELGMSKVVFSPFGWGE
ncbi:MAG: hypothetical protein JKX70_05285, partial [Phycisphaerales bacterium]|nr:hypothetical protein [Phycisphaerales bacterium]